MQPDIVNGMSQSKKGVFIRPPYYGGVDGVRYLDPLFKQETVYLEPMYQYFTQFGYIGGVNFRSAPIDFRLGPRNWMSPGGSFDDFLALIEDTYKINNNTRVHLIGHSIGGAYIQTFLAYKVSQEWKDKHIESFMSLCGAHDGVTNTPVFLSQGFNFGIPIVKPSELMDPARHMASVNWMIPTLFNQDQMCIVSDKKNYTFGELALLYKDLNLEEPYKLYVGENEKFDKRKAPGVETHCVCGIDHGTGIEYYIKDVNVPEDRTIKARRNIPGDGCVTKEGLDVCANFDQDRSKYPVKSTYLPKVGHVNIIHDQRVYDYILKRTIH